MCKGQNHTDRALGWHYERVALDRKNQVVEEEGTDSVRWRQMTDAGGCVQALQEEEEAQSLYKRQSKKEFKKVSNREWETISTVDGEQYTQR